MMNSRPIFSFILDPLSLRTHASPYVEFRAVFQFNRNFTFQKAPQNFQRNGSLTLFSIGLHNCIGKAPKAVEKNLKYRSNLIYDYKKI